MPVQTTKGEVSFPDGGKVSIKESGAGSYTDVGVILSAVTFTLDYDENQVETANWGKTQKQIRNMTIGGSFTLGNINDTDVLQKMSGGMFEEVSTTATPVTTSPDQVIATGWADNTLYDLVIETSSSDSTLLKASAQPTLTSVTLDAGTPEVLTEDNDYVVVQNANSASGWSIQFISAGMTTPSPTTYTITIDYASVTPVATTTIYAGSSTEVLTAYALKIEHTNSSSVIDRSFEIFATDPNSGGFVFDFKGANEDGLDEMPLTFTGNIDTSRADGRQLFSYVIAS